MSDLHTCSDCDATAKIIEHKHYVNGTEYYITCSNSKCRIRQGTHVILGLENAKKQWNYLHGYHTGLFHKIKRQEKP